MVSVNNLVLDSFNIICPNGSQSLNYVCKLCFVSNGPLCYPEPSCKQFFGAHSNVNFNFN